jgi:hypothetical protein
MESFRQFVIAHIQQVFDVKPSEVDAWLSANPINVEGMSSLVMQYAKLVQEEQIRLCAEEAYDYIESGPYGAGFNDDSFSEKVTRAIQ